MVCNFHERFAALAPVRSRHLKRDSEQVGDDQRPEPSASDFDATAQAAALRTQTRALHKRQYRRRQSRLDVYTSELLALHAAGASVAELQRWLRERRIKVVHSTVARWLARHG